MHAVFIAVCTTILAGASALAQEATFTYQGVLTHERAPATGPYDLGFALFDAPEGGHIVGQSNLVAGLTVRDGTFTAHLDFGLAAFDGTPRWLQVTVRPAGSGEAFTPLTPRQSLDPAPYALFAHRAGVASVALLASNVSTGAISAAQLQSSSPPAPGQSLSWDGTSLAWTSDIRSQASTNSPPRLWVYVSSGLLWIRTPFDSTNDALLSITRTNLNGIMSFSQYHLCPTNAPIGAQQWPGTYDISDDICPLSLYDAGYVGANHGWYLPTVTSSNHGLSTLDLGKAWRTGTNSFALYRIIDAHTLALLPKPCPYANVSPASISTSAYLLPSSGVLTNLTASSNLVYSAKSGIQDTPCGRVTCNSILLDGQPYFGQMAQGGELTIQCSIDFPNATAAYDYAVTHVGQQFSIATNLPTWFTRSQVYRFYPWGQVSVEEHLNLLTASLSFGDGNGPIQSARLAPNSAYATTNLWLRVPGGSNSWQVPSLNHTDLTTYFTAPQRSDPGHPHRRWVQWAGQTNLLTPTNFSWGTAMGYEDVWDTSDSTRSSLATDGWIYGPTRKIYPSAIVGRTVTAPASLHFRAWRSFFGKNADGLLCRLLLKADSGWASFLGWNSPGTNFVTLPAWLNGRYCGISQASGADLRSARVDGGVLIARTNATGWIELWIK